MENNLKNRLHQEVEKKEPLAGHQDRFETKLLIANKEHNRKRPRIYYLFAAACVLGAVMAVVIWKTKQETIVADKIKNEKKQAYQLADFSYKAAAKEKFFKTEISKRQHYNQADPAIQPLLKRLEKLEKVHLELQDQIENNARNEAVIKALLNNYQLRLEILEKLQRIIEYKNKSKENNHEKITS